MNSDSRLRSLPSHSTWALLLMFGLGLLLAGGSAFGVSGNGTPATPVPQPRWNSSSSLQPGPILGDSTHFVGHSDPRNGDTLEYHGVDIENGMLFAATGQGLQIFDLSGQTPTLKSYIYGYFSSGQFPGWQHLGDKDWFLKYLDAPEGNSSLVALGMEEQGFAIANTSNPVAPVVAYHGKLPVTEVYSFTGGGTAWAYAIAMDGGAIHRFNLSAASSLNKCLEVPPISTCAGVYKGAVSSLGSTNGTLHGVGNFLATGRSFREAGTYKGFLKLWSLSDTGAPTLITDLGGPALALGMWQSGNSYYVARLEPSKKLTIYNASCIASGSCGSMPAIWSTTLTSPTQLSHLSVSKDGGKHYLYVGGDDLSNCAPQREYIFDVSTPTAPEELTPKIHPDGYWGWYYMSCSTGFNLVGPRAGKVSGGVLYRAAMSLLDSHKIGHAGPPVANFTFGPKAPDTEIYAGTQVQFTDSSAGQVTSWSWSFQGGTPPSAASRTPVVTFDTVGTKAVNLVVTNGAGLQSSPISQTVTVLDPTPTLGGVGVTPANPGPTVCQPVTLKAVTAKGRAALQYDFKVEDANGTPVPGAGAVGTADSYTWNTGAGTPAGNYTAKLTLSNTAGSVTKTSAFTLTPLTALPLAGTFSPSNETFTAGTVQFHVNVPGATEWSWDFDDDLNPATTSWTAWSNDPSTGPSPSHSYTSKGIHQVRVRVKNCTTTSPDGILSAALPVDIKVITPLKADFRLNKQLVGDMYLVSAGEEIQILDGSTGAEFWDYDWDANGSYEDSGNTGPRTTHTFNTAGTFAVKLRVRRGGNEEAFDTRIVKVDPADPAPVKSISISGPSTGQPGSALSFSASAQNCTPSTTWNWSSDGGTVTGSGNQVTISWANQGNKTVSVTNSGCSGVTGSKSVTIGNGNPPPGQLKAEFTFTPTAPAVGQAVSFNGAASTGNPTGYVWDFGDGSVFGSGAQISHTYAQPGTYRVQLSVTKPGSCAPAPFCEAAITKNVTVGTGEAPLGAAFQTSATCISEFGLNVCSAQAGQTVTFNDQTTGGPTGWSWNFGDGGTATGASASHVFKKNGTFTVTLTATRGAVSATTSRTFNITGGTNPPPASSNTIVLPWIAQSRGVLQQSSDLYVHNPGTSAMEIVLEFRKRGLPEVNPPKATRTIEPGATLYVADVLKELFNWENIVGFVTITRTKGDAQPVMTSFNTTFGADGSQFGQTVPGVSLSVETAAATTGSRMQYLVGLNDNGDREAYFGITNPNAGPATYRLKFFDSLGRPIGTSSADLRLSSFGLKQFQPAEVRSTFGINTQDDYRVEVETVSGGQLFPYGANVRTTSDDPSFLGVGLSSKSKLYLIGALSTPGINNTKWQTDLVVANTSTGVALTDVTFTRAGVTAQTTTPVRLTLQSGETQRLENIVATKWNIKDSVGVLTIESDSPNSVFPIVQGESYETTHSNAGMRFGQFMAAFTDEDAAGPGQAHYLVGLRQDASSRTTYWLYNPSNEPGSYDLIYRALNGTELGRIAAASLGAGKLRQLSPSQHPLPAAGASGGFTVQVVVRSGKVISAAQVINNKTNDPAYVQGQVQK